MLKKVIVMLCIFLIANSVIVAAYQKNELEVFEEKVKKQRQRQDDFFESEGLKRIDSLANSLTFGRGKTLKERTCIGATSQEVVRGIMQAPIVVGGHLALAGDKITLIGKGLAMHEINKGAIGKALLLKRHPIGMKKRPVRTHVLVTAREKEFR